MRYRPLILGAALAMVQTVTFAQQPSPKPSPPAPSVPAPAPAQTGPAQPFDVEVARRITAAEVKRRMDAGKPVLVIDTRGKFVGPILKGAVHMPADKLEAWAKTVPKDAFIVAYCT